MALDRDAFRRALAGAPLVSRLDLYDELETTMDRARDLARAGAPAGTLVVAGRQTRGRGRAGHAWISPEGGLYLSLLLDRPPLERDLLAPPIVAALAVRAALAGVGIEARIKWPNDVLVGRRKIAGAIGEVLERLIDLGIGINVNVEVDALPEDVRGLATSVHRETGRAHDPAALARALVDELAARIGRWRAADRALADETRAALILEHPVRWRAPFGIVYEGRPAGIGPRGELTIDAPGGRLTAHGGDLEILWTS